MTTTEAVIQKTTNLMGGEACIRRTRIAVWMLVQARQLGISDAQLLTDYTGLKSDDLDSAWEYYRGHPVEIEPRSLVQRHRSKSR
jgi:uncharacterized protein (DUF433 family)